MIHTQNTERGLFSLQVKLSLIIFPVIFSTVNWSFMTKNQMMVIFNAFIIGCVFSTILCLGNAIIEYIDTSNPEVFFYTYLSFFHHASYLSMYLSFSIAILSYYLVVEKWKNNSQLLTWLGLIVYFLIFIIMLSSKAGIISMGLVLILGLSYYIFKKRKYVNGIVATILIAVMFFSFMKLMSIPQSRFNASVEAVQGQDDLDDKSSESTGERLLIWKYSLEIIKENILFGAGTGDVQAKLLDKYREKEFTKAFEIKLNAHNQYIETTIAIGITGLLILTFTLLLSLLYGLKTNNLLFIVFIVIVGFNFLFESMLERQGGVVFYAFMNVFLFNTKR
jgi:O-antigen ligase